MKVVDVVKKIKEIHKNYVVMVKIGNFCHTYGRDSYIISYLFEYKTKIIEENISTCGFPLASLNKVISKLENQRINYIMLERRNNYEVDLKSDNKNLNEYEEIFKVARIYVNYKKRME